MSTQIKELRNYIYPNEKYSNIRSNRRSIKKRFPEIYELIKDDYHTKLYMLLNDIKEVPKCKNPKCNNKVKLKSISKGFHSFCCNTCIGEFQQTDKEFSEKIRKTHLSKNILAQKYYPLDIQYKPNNKNYFIIHNYCKHGDIEIYVGTFKKLYKQKKCLCYKCNQELFDNYTPSEKEIEKFQSEFGSFYNTNRFKFTEKWWITNYPKEYKIIHYYTKHLNISVVERIFLFKNKLKDIPKCLNCGLNTRFNHSQMRYTYFCDSPACVKNVSKGELEVLEYVKSLNKSTQSKLHIDKREFDIYVPDKHLAIEFNGLYWHSEEHQRDREYHIKKRQLAFNNDIRLITVWEDDWKYKQDIVKSILKNALYKTKNKIYARKCLIKEVSYADAQLFINNNHIQGYTRSSINLGLYYNNELVSIMTFGNKRMIMKSHSKNKNEYELLRFCSKINASVIGGASKLFSHFIKHYNPETIISYANCDISNGNLYNKLGFKFISHTGLNYWWVKNEKRYHRSNFMKHKLVAQGEDPLLTEDEIMASRGYTKVFGTGNLKYVWEVLN